MKYDLNAIRELELLTIKKVGEQKFWCVAEDQSDNSMSGTYYSCRANLYTASCEKRINVIMEALGIND